VRTQRLFRKLDLHRREIESPQLARSVCREIKKRVAAATPQFQRSDTGDAVEKMEGVFRRCERPILRQRRAAMKARSHVIPALAIRGQSNFR
jgi:hypothetical protein